MRILIMTIAVAVVVTLLLANNSYARYSQHGQYNQMSNYNNMQSNGEIVYVKVNGLVCDFCARSLEQVFDKHAAVSNINVDLNDKIVQINFNQGRMLNDQIIVSLVTDAGYNVESIYRYR
ncbi:MAG: hypothetical protein AAF195_04775 [Pseudomonadota bacterium]